MTAPMQTVTRIHYAPDTVVTLRTDPVRGSVADGDLPPSRALGPGFVCEPEIFGKTHVHWIELDVDAWMNAADLQALDPAARLVSIFHCDQKGTRSFLRHKLTRAQGLEHNWAVDLLPSDLIRAIRSDGATWTFNWYPSAERVEYLRTVGQLPAEDADAEALTAAEMAVGVPGWSIRRRPSEV